MSDKIYPLAYTLAPDQTCVLYYLGFPESWKETLLDIERKYNPNFKAEYGLPTTALKKLILSWTDGVITLAPLKKDSKDERWLTSCYPYSKKDIEVICELIKVWVKATYVTISKVSPQVKKLAMDFCKNINAEELLALQSSSVTCLTLDDGTVCNEAYEAIPLLVSNRLLGEEVVLGNQAFQLCYCAKNQLISQPLTDPSSQHQYSFVFDFSVQTTPPKRKALLLCQMSVRRWVPDSERNDSAPVLKENINAHIKVGQTKYCQVKIVYNPDTKQIYWNEQDKECYNLWGYKQLPPAEDILLNPAVYAPDIILPYKNGMWGMTESKIGTGVSMIDKTSLYQSIYTLLQNQNMVCGKPEATRVSLKGHKFLCFSDPQEYASPEEFREWVKKCVETDKIIFEIYGLWKDPAQQELLYRIQDKIEQDFGPDNEISCLKVWCVQKEVGALTDALPDNKRQTKIRYSDEYVSKIGKADAVTACIFVLPGPDQYEKGDPKQVLRNAFARTGRVVQFITPTESKEYDKVKNAVYDLYRQLGIVTLLETDKKLPPLAYTPCIGMHLCSFLLPPFIPSP